ncbi:MAG: hypothetical protein ABI162_14730 [Luteolibacter sp.]
MIKLSRRIKIWTAVLIVLLPGLLCVALIPASIEGVYNPLSFSSTMGCDCDQFEEFREGRVIFHVMEGGGNSISTTYYEKDPSGSIMIRLLPDHVGEKGELLARAEPHLLGTMFYYPDRGTSEWAWKRFVTNKMKTKMAGAKIQSLVHQKEGARLNTYDSNFKVLSSTFRPNPPTSGALPPKPERK